MEKAQKKSSRYSSEVRERTIRMVLGHQGEYESQWKAIVSIAGKTGCTAETLRTWVRQAERDQDERSTLAAAEQERLEALKQENRELRQTNEILRKASAYFAQAALDRRLRS